MSPTSGASTIVTKTGTGSVNLTATILNSCGTQTTTKTITLFAGSPPTITLIRASNETCDGIKYHYVPFEIPNRNPLITYTYNIAPIPGVPVTVSSQTYNGVLQDLIVLPNTYTGTIDLTVISTNSCGSSSYNSEQNINSCTNLGLRSSNSIEYFTAFPNPAKEIINIELLAKKRELIKNANTKAELFDMFGIRKNTLNI